MRELIELAEKLERTRELTQEEWTALIEGRNAELEQYVFSRARAVREQNYGKAIYIRGLIEISNYCKNDCYYCGIRRSNRHASRYRLSREEILACCAAGYELGFRTFVMQGGEDPHLTDDWVCETVAAIRRLYPDCAITLSLGEKEKDSYQRFFDAGANRYLLRHETADVCHYGKLHPSELSLEHRLQCLRDLKTIGYQTGCGFMVGSPYQTTECLAKDMRWIGEFKPEMVGIGPFLPQHDTPFGDKAAGDFDLSVYLLGLLRLLLPNVLLPATTALATLHPQGRNRGILAGANVVMPNLSPQGVRKKYLLYDNKAGTGTEAAESLELLKAEMASLGYEIVTDRGDYKK